MKKKNTFSKPLFIHGYIYDISIIIVLVPKWKALCIVLVEIFNVELASSSSPQIVTIDCQDGPAARSNRMSRPALRYQLRLTYVTFSLDFFTLYVLCIAQ